MPNDPFITINKQLKEILKSYAPLVNDTINFPLFETYKFDKPLSE